MPANIVIYDMNARFNKHKMSFSRKLRPIVEKWNNDKVCRVEIQTFAHRSNNRKTNSLASVLNAMEILKIMMGVSASPYALRTSQPRGDHPAHKWFRWNAFSHLCYLLAWT